MCMSGHRRPPLKFLPPAVFSRGEGEGIVHSLMGVRKTQPLCALEGPLSFLHQEASLATSSAGLSGVSMSCHHTLRIPVYRRKREGV